MLWNTVGCVLLVNLGSGLLCLTDAVSSFEIGGRSCLGAIGRGILMSAKKENGMQCSD